MQRRRTIRHIPPITRRGFTLVEMLVATGLVVLIMLMFAQIYGTAIRSITDQRALSNNNQSARRFVSIMRSDLQRMTYRQPEFPYGDVEGIVPMAAGDESLIDPNNQRGYFFLSENDIYDATDDRIQFTVMLKVGERGDANTSRGRNVLSGKTTNISGVRNQPGLDDGDTEFDTFSVGVSRFAEISYFLRDGNLYRRMLLLRDPLSATTRQNTQPTFNNGNQIYNLANTDYDPDSDGALDPNTRNSFHDDFDYAATREFGHFYFNSLESLKNTEGQRNVPLAMSRYRFGFSPLNGRPWEFLPKTGKYIGSFTLRETSSNNFTFPGRDRPTSNMDTDKINPYRRSATENGINLTYDEQEKSIELYRNGNRAGEDIMLANVESMDIEVWDNTLSDFLGGFRNLGFRPERDLIGDIIPSDYDHLQNRNKDYVVQLDLNGDDTADDRNGPDGDPGVSGVDDDIDGNTDDSLEQGWPGSDDTISRNYDTWHPNSGAGSGNPPFQPLITRIGLPWTASTPASIGFVVLPLAGEDLNLNGNLDPGEDADGDMNLDFPGQAPSGALRAIVLTGGTRGSREPEWPRTPGAIVQDGSVTWQIQDNRIGLRAIRMTIRFKDQNSGSSRQVTLVHSFVE